MFVRYHTKLYDNKTYKDRTNNLYVCELIYIVVFGITYIRVNIMHGCIVNIIKGPYDVSTSYLDITLGKLKFEYCIYPFRLSEIRNGEITLTYDGSRLLIIEYNSMKLDYSRNTFRDGSFVYKYNGDKLCMLTEKMLAYTNIEEFDLSNQLMGI